MFDKPVRWAFASMARIEDHAASDGATADRRSGQAETCPEGGPVDNPGIAGEPRPQAVAGNECGAWGELIKECIANMEDLSRPYERPLSESGQWFA